MSDFGLDENELQGVELLDVSHPDSPYALIQDVLKNSIQPANPSGVNDLGGLSPNDVWLVDGDLLILKGGTTSGLNFFLIVQKSKFSTKYRPEKMYF